MSNSTTMTQPKRHVIWQAVILMAELSELILLKKNRIIIGKVDSEEEEEEEEEDLEVDMEVAEEETEEDLEEEEVDSEEEEVDLEEEEVEASQMSTNQQAKEILTDSKE